MCFLVFVLVTAIYFYGVGFNLLFLWVVIVALTGLFVLRGPGHALASMDRQPWLYFSCFATLGLLTLSHNFFSISYDSSFAASLIAASLPLVVLTTRIEDAQKTFRVAAWLVFVFAALSVVEFIWQGQRAHTPLFDPNNYVTLLYLAWIPWILERITHKVSARQVLVSAVVTVLVCIAMLATTSRFALVVIVGMALLVLFLSWRHAFDWRNSAAVLVSMAIAFIAASVFDPSGLNEAFADNATQTQASAEDTRMLMLQSALTAMGEHGSVFGTGLFTFSLLYPQVRSELEQVTTAQFVHNDFVQLALEGGVLLLVPLFVLLWAVSRESWVGLFRVNGYTPSFGYVVAIGVAFIHALVNFVFYVLPLMVMLGFVCVNAFQRAPASTGDLKKTPRWLGVTSWAATSVGLLYCCFLLANDTLTYGVFSAQDHVPYAAQIRKDPDRLLQFSGISQKINGQRGVPILGEARLREVVLSKKNENTRPSDDELNQIALIYQRALEVDPWNPAGYTNYYKYLSRYQLVDHDRLKHLLVRARQLDPVHLDAIALSIDHAVIAGDQQAGLTVVADMLRWCEYLSRRRAQSFENMLKRLAGSNLMAGADQALSQQLYACLNHPGFKDSDGREPTAVMRWLRGES